MSENAKDLYEDFKREYVSSGYMYSGHLEYTTEKKNAFKELLENGIIQRRNCEAYCFELSQSERISLVKEFNLETVWEKEHSCFLANGKFEEIEMLSLE